MTVAVTITSDTANVHYGFFPEPVINTNGNGINSDVPHWGYLNPWQLSDGTLPTPETVTINLQTDITYFVSLDIEGAAPVRFPGFQPGSGGDVFELLTAQGWTQ